MLTNDQLYRAAPSIFATQPHDSRSSHYEFVPTTRVLHELAAQGFQPFTATQSRTTRRNQDQAPYTKHLIRLRNPDLPALSDDEVPEIILINSHNGASSFRIMLGFYRFACANGLIVGSSVQDVSVRHDHTKGERGLLDDIIEGTFTLCKEIPGTLDRIDVMKHKPLYPIEQLDFAEEAFTLRWPDTPPPISAHQLIQPRRNADTPNNLWTLYQRVQEWLVKGGIKGRTVNNKRTTTRGVKGIDDSVKLNRRLWDLAAGYVQ